MGNKSGFTLIELLIVIALIAILAAGVFVALDPLTRFRDARDATRFTDITAIVNALKVDQVDNGGAYVTAVANLTADTDYMIGTDTGVTCDPTADTNQDCDVVIAQGNCVDITALQTEGYLGFVPVSQNGTESWTAGHAGYYLRRNANNSVTVGACESENVASINVTQ